MVASCLLQGASLGLLPRLTCSCPRAWLRKSAAAGGGGGGGGGRPVSLARGLAGRPWRAALPPATAPKQVAHVQWQTARPYGNDAETGGTDREQHEAAGKPRKKTPPPPGKQTVSSIGRRIDARVVHLVDENGTDLGHVHRANAIRMMEERGLKLVALREDADPPFYQLMSGKQIYNEQLKLRQKQQDKPQSGQTQIKEISFSADIGKSDLEVKVRKIQEWVLEKRHHVRVSIKNTKKKSDTDKMLAMAGSVLEPIADNATYVSAPRAVNDGATVTCILRHMSERERAEQRRKHGADGANATKNQPKREAHKGPEVVAAQGREASGEEADSPAAGGIGSTAQEQAPEQAQELASQNTPREPKDGRS
ncbi:translation initiation factor IF-3, mitochondrial [Petromyzon marinus]|uniref:translation initiation factor IF-3, mitochondrial n=1 Tax=Petromyzon marinus TaxID=7757 RepID=UPI003F72AADB